MGFTLGLRCDFALLRRYLLLLLFIFGGRSFVRMCVVFFFSLDRWIRKDYTYLLLRYFTLHMQYAPF